MAISTTSLNQAYSKVQQIDNSTPQKRILDNQAHQAEKFQLEGFATNKAPKGQVNDVVPLSKEQQKVETQANIIHHLFGEGAPREQNALRILYQEAIDKLNEVLKPDLGENAISTEKLAEQGGMDYWTPENTANRIVQGTTAFFQAYKDSNPDLQGEELLDKFLGVIGGGIETGFKDATDILEGFGVYDGSIKENAEKTYDLVQKGLQAFRDQQMEALGLTSTTTEETLTQTSESD